MTTLRFHNTTLFVASNNAFEREVAWCYELAVCFWLKLQSESMNSAVKYCSGYLLRLILNVWAIRLCIESWWYGKKYRSVEFHGYNEKERRKRHHEMFLGWFIQVRITCEEAGMIVLVEAGLLDDIFRGNQMDFRYWIDHRKWCARWYKSWCQVYQSIVISIDQRP